MKKRGEHEQLRIDSIDFDPTDMQMYVFANRSLRVLDLHSGRIKYILSFGSSSSDEDYTCFRYFPNSRKIVLGCSNGSVSILNG